MGDLNTTARNAEEMGYAPTEDWNTLARNVTEREYAPTEDPSTPAGIAGEPGYAPMENEKHFARNLGVEVAVSAHMERQGPGVVIVAGGTFAVTVANHSPAKNASRHARRGGPKSEEKWERGAIGLSDESWAGHFNLSRLRNKQ
jgi:hypothetical protein